MAGLGQAALGDEVSGEGEQIVAGFHGVPDFLGLGCGAKRWRSIGLIR